MPPCSRAAYEVTAKIGEGGMGEVYRATPAAPLDLRPLHNQASGLTHLS